MERGGCEADGVRVLFLYSFWYNRKMNKRYWLRGGIAGLIFVILSSFFMLANRDFAESLVLSPPIIWLNSMISYSLYFIFGLKMPSFLTSYILWIDYFTIGVILGWLYGKIKNRNKVV
ncbi:hypothetical protein A3H53_00930 [Candidatus Nomurabacteria bacterium RIFCSPLOWO2_02_FULL_40_10]|uniref:Uncharacterized protein n=1 Tax=Candidatus Nomurabacteria bacterium RIFCSPLOWO2_02_FULL_40_10 TaxID=1801786 RepID=A0A1F6XZY6_9BACT|nr:MAG: hypothetical protein A3H53_00930 [Candidatus Nomurabacteria bacterium RIFCSPLOWO2_02_FULL_40_10]